MKKVVYVFMAAGLLMCGCGGQGEKESKGDSIASDLIENFDADASAQITFDEEMHDFGNLSAGEQVSYSFHFRNTGKKDLVITGCGASCGCTVPSYPQGRIAPGKDGYVTVSFNSSGKAGETYEEVTVVSNSQPGRKTLRIRAKVGI